VKRRVAIREFDEVGRLERRRRKIPPQFGNSENVSKKGKPNEYKAVAANLLVLLRQMS
jgi:hypothetical protein